MDINLVKFGNDYLMRWEYAQQPYCFNQRFYWLFFKIHSQIAANREDQMSKFIIINKVG